MHSEENLQLQIDKLSEACFHHNNALGLMLGATRSLLKEFRELQDRVAALENAANARVAAAE